jgi:hypothetical protein
MNDRSRIAAPIDLSVEIGALLPELWFERADFLVCLTPCLLAGFGDLPHLLLGETQVGSKRLHLLTGLGSRWRRLRGGESRDGGEDGSANDHEYETPPGDGRCARIPAPKVLNLEGPFQMVPSR